MSARHKRRPASAVLLALLALVGCQREAALPPPQGSQITSLVKDDIRKGKGIEVQPGAVAVVHYTGWLYDPAVPDNKGAQFDSSHDRGQPFRFTVGSGAVIAGWDQGVVGMKPSGRRELIVPPQLAYGERGAGRAIPPNATLLFDIELLAVE